MAGSVQAEERQHGQDHHDEAYQIDYPVHEILSCAEAQL
jgi:hypothetical protein